MVVLRRSVLVSLVLVALCACEPAPTQPVAQTPAETPVQPVPSKPPAEPPAPAAELPAPSADPAAAADEMLAADGAEDAQPPRVLGDEDSGRVNYALGEDANFGLVSLAVATGLEDRQPTGVGSNFGLSDGVLTGWAEVRNKDVETQITMVWRKDGQEKSRTPVKVGVSPGWRTWTRKRLGKRDAGAWELEVVGASGDSLGKLAFTVTADLPRNCAAAGGTCMEGCEPGWRELSGGTREQCYDSVCCTRKK